jgi:uncharacterized protein YndB with AHSA1/START domain
MDNVLTITRRFAAPRDIVWKSWSEAERIGRWWGPKGCVIEVKNFEFRPGGFFHYAMRFPGGEPMWGRFMYREISAPGQIAWLNSFSNSGCGIARAPFGGAIPLEIHNDVTFTDEGGKTLLTLRSHPHGATAEEEEVFRGMFASLQQGWGGTMDQLEGYLAQTR